MQTPINDIFSAYAKLERRQFGKNSSVEMQNAKIQLGIFLARCTIPVETSDEIPKYIKVAE